MQKFSKILNKSFLTVLFIIHKVYKLCLSPLLGHTCRFYPTCSDYALEAVEKFGFLKGTKMALIRVAKCGPWHKGGEDKIVLEKKK